jgi:hypothetical protein
VSEFLRKDFLSFCHLTLGDFLDIRISAERFSWLNCGSLTGLAAEYVFRFTSIIGMNGVFILSGIFFFQNLEGSDPD